MVGQWKRVPWGLRVFEGIATFLVGVTVGTYSGSIPLSGGLAAVFRKIVFGDWDVGQAWTVQDIGFWILAFLEGALGGWIAITRGLHTKTDQKAMRELMQVDRFYPSATRMPGENEGSQTWYFSNEGARTDALNGGS